MSIPVAIFRAGTVTAPGLAVLGETNLGFYKVTTAHLGIASRGLACATFLGVASAVNNLKVSNAVTGSPIVIEAVGSDTDIGIKLLPKGAGRVQLPDGTLALPAATFTSDPDTGIYRIGANNIGLVVKAVAALELAADSGTPLNWVKITSGATGAAALIAAAQAGSPISLNAATTGVINIGNVSTGLVRIGTATTKVPITYRANTDVDAQNATPTIAQLLGGIITHTSVTGAGTCTVPTGSATSAGIAGITTGDSFDAVYYNDGNQTVTITAGASGSTILGTAAITTGKSCILRFVCTGSNTWVTYVLGFS